MTATPTLRIGLVVPASNTVAEVDFYRSVPEHVTVHIARAQMHATTADAQRGMLDDALPTAVAQLASLHPDVVVIAATSAMALLGPQGEQDYLDRMAEIAHCPVISTTSICARALLAVGGKIGLFTPYNDELTDSLAASLRDSGVEVAASIGLGLTDNKDIVALEPNEIADQAVAWAEVQQDLDGVFVSCTNLRVLPVRAAIEARLGLPVVTSNSASIDAALDTLNAHSAA